MDRQQSREAIFLALAQVPKGKVITYGNLAKLAGIPNGARLVGRIVCDLPEGSNLPWHRVINSQGRISIPSDSIGYREQKKRLAAEGVEFVNEKIKLSTYAYQL